MSGKPDVSWNLDGGRARLHCGELQAQVDLNCLPGGIHCLVYKDVQLHPFQLFQLTPSGAADVAAELLPDSYIRGFDLVTSYAQTPDSAIVRQIYWRAMADGDPHTCGVELWVSSQTDLLESDPLMACASRLPLCDVHRLSDAESGPFESLPLKEGESVELTLESGASAFLFRPPNADWSCCAMIHPADFTRATITAGQGELRFVTQLFENEHLEKGVIRRARLRCLFVPRQDDAQRARDSYREFVSSQLPLTA